LPVVPPAPELVPEPPAPVPEPPVPELELDELLVALETQTLPEQTWPAPQVPQAIVPPQPSGAVPQSSPAGQAVALDAVSG
jgi:hypothetical protein